MDRSHQAKLNNLKELKGADFNKEYRELQISAHQGAVALFERYAARGEIAPLKDWAKKMLPILQEHLKMAEALNK